MSISSSSTLDDSTTGLGAAGLIAQTDENGNPLFRANVHAGNREIIQSRRVDQAEMAFSKQKMFSRRRVQEMEDDDSCDDNNDIGSGYKHGSSSTRPMITLLPKQLPNFRGKKCLVLDLDETLVHSSFKPVKNPDYIVPVTIDGTTHRVYVLKRPGVDLFLERLGKLYEIIVFTASLKKYADPLLDMLDVNHVIEGRLFRESCTCHQGNYVKDLTLLGRDINSVIIVDNSPASYLFQPENAIGVSTFIDDMDDKELFYGLPFLESLVDVRDVRDELGKYPEFIARQSALQA